MSKRMLGLAALALVVFASSATASATPRRIVSLSPTATEDLFAIGAGKQVVAVDDQSNYPASAPHSKLSGYTPNAEAIAKYNPDLVVVSNDTNGIVAALGKLHIRVLVEPAAASLDADLAQIRALGAATGHIAAAGRVVAGVRRQVTQIVASVPAAAKGISVYEELSPDYYSATSKTFTGQALKLLGLNDIADKADKSGSGYPKLSAEYIVAADPKLIVLADTKCCGENAAKVRQRPGWNTISAVKNGAIVGVDDDVASRWGPRIVDYMRAVAGQLRNAIK